MYFDGNCSAGSGESAAQENDFRGAETLEIQKDEPIRSSERIVWRGWGVRHSWSDTNAAF
jgi:hypothetical protein